MRASRSNENHPGPPPKANTGENLVLCRPIPGTGAPQQAQPYLIPLRSEGRGLLQPLLPGAAVRERFAPAPHGIVLRRRAGQKIRVRFGQASAEFELGFGLAPRVGSAHSATSVPLVLGTAGVLEHVGRDYSFRIRPVGVRVLDGCIDCFLVLVWRAGPY